MIEDKITEYPTVYDAIVIGTGISGGWAAKELCENGLKTLVLDRGRMVKHIEDYPTMHMDPWDSKFKGEVKRDHLNNNLTDRLNSDIAIKKFQKKEKKKKEFIRPFDENKKSSYENYFNDLPKDDFSNRRILT